MKTNFDGPRVVPWMSRLRCVMIPALILILLLPLSATPARAAASTVVGDGTPESCTLDALNQAIAAVPVGGTITFDCGPNRVTMWIFDVYIQKDLTIDGGGLITFSGGSRGGDGLRVFAGATARFIDFTVANAIGACGGPIYNEGTLTLHHITVSNNGTAHGCGSGGIYNQGDLTIEDSTITENEASCDIDGSCGDAGGIGNLGTLHIVNSTISGNGAVGPGGGIWSNGTATIENSTISGNGTGCQTYYDNNTDEPYLVCYPGGGIYNTGILSLINSTVSGNSTGSETGGDGGGLYNTGTLFLQNTTIADNTAQAGGGLANNNSAVIQNSLLAGNKDTNQRPSDCSGILTSQGYNLIGDAAGCTLIGDTTGNLLDVDPLLGPLQDNGGPTLTHNLLPGSPAMDVGNPATPGSGGTACNATDQRGVTRPLDGDNNGLARCDIGAVEARPSSRTVLIDIKPGDDTNPINLKSKGVIPVAILSNSTFKAKTLDPASVKFGRNEATSVSSSLEDVNGDGRLDLVLHFLTQQTGIRPVDTQACLTGLTQSGRPIQGCDKIHVLLASAPPGLILWNKLGSRDEVLSSEFGPDLGFYTLGDCHNAGCLDGWEIQGNPVYVPGIFGNALTLEQGNYFSEARVHNAVLRDYGAYISAERGAVEMWFQETTDPQPWNYGIYRLFDGAYGLGDGIGVWVQTADQYDMGPARLMYSLRGICNVQSESDGQDGYEISAYNNTWIHIAAVWDRSGIAGTAKTMELFINGAPVASTTCSDWPTAFSGTIDIGGGNDDQIAGKFGVDNLKVWNYAKTDYSDRLVEGFKK